MIIRCNNVFVKKKQKFLNLWLRFYLIGFLKNKKNNKAGPHHDGGLAVFRAVSRNINVLQV